MMFEWCDEIVPAKEDPSEEARKEQERRDETRRSKIAANWKKVCRSFPNAIIERMLPLARADYVRDTEPHDHVGVPVLFPYTAEAALRFLTEMAAEHSLVAYDARAYYYSDLRMNTYRHETTSMVDANGDSIRHRFSNGAVIIFYEFKYNMRKYRIGLMMHRDSKAASADNLRRYWKPRDALRADIMQFIKECRERKMQRMEKAK